MAAIGIEAQINKASIEVESMQVIVQLEAALENIADFHAYLARAFPTDQNLADFLSYTLADAQAFRGAITDLENLRLTAIGQRAQTPANNFLFNAQKLKGWN